MRLEPSTAFYAKPRLHRLCCRSRQDAGWWMLRFQPSTASHATPVTLRLEPRTAPMPRSPAQPLPHMSRPLLALTLALALTLTLTLTLTRTLTRTRTLTLATAGKKYS